MNGTDYQTNRFPTWCPGCVLPGTLIYSNPGLKQIESLKNGEKVLGNDGVYHRVSKTYAHKHKGKLYKITSKYFGSTILTPEHPVLIVERTHKKLHNKTFPIIWQKAEDLKKGDYLVYPITKQIQDLPAIEIPWIKKEKDTRSKVIPRNVNLDKKFFTLAGLYIAEGWVHRRSINYCFNIREKYLAQTVLTYFNECFGIQGKIKIDKNKNTTDVIFNSSLLSRVFEYWFGRGAINKKIPHFILGLPNNKLSWLIKALWLGDGYIRENIGRASYKTISKILSEQIKTILLRFGIVPTITWYKAYKFHKESYSIQIVSQRDYTIFARIMNKYIHFTIKPGGKPPALINEDLVLLPIRRIESYDYTGLVFNLEVEDVNCYVSENAVLHNCGDFGIWGALKNSFAKMGWQPWDFAVVFGIGCSGNMADFIKCYGFHSLHGRALPNAVGLKIANHKLPVVVVSGDGDCYGEGGNHFIHTCRGNHDISLVVHDNRVYGLTTGQVAPTAAQGYKSKSTPEGIIEVRVNPLALAITQGATFVAQGFAGDIPHLTQLLIDSYNHRGFSLVNVLQPCVTFNKINTYIYYREHTYKLDQSHNTSDKIAALSVALDNEKIPLGILYKEERKTYEQSLPQISTQTLVEKAYTIESISEFLTEFK